MEWTPFSEMQLSSLIADAECAMTPAARALWELCKVRPTKWQSHPWGDLGGGFWVVGIIGQRVVWYNDIEGGFNFSRYDTPGHIAEYLCNQDELQHTMYFLIQMLETGETPGRFGPPQPVSGLG